MVKSCYLLESTTNTRTMAYDIYFFQRLFLVDGVISLPIALSGFFVLPDVPEIANPWYLSKKVTLRLCLSSDDSVLIVYVNRRSH
jgi:hypothetical protein